LNKSNQLTIEFSSLPENVSFARVAVAAFASQLEFTLNDLEEIKVMVSEAVGNSIIHGYNNSTGKTVKIFASLSGQVLTLSVQDTGQGIGDVKRAMEAGYSTDPERMGLGFVFMQSFAEDMDVKSALGEGTTVTLTRRVLNNTEAAQTGQ